MFASKNWVNLEHTCNYYLCAEFLEVVRTVANLFITTLDILTNQDTVMAMQATCTYRESIRYYS